MRFISSVATWSHGVASAGGLAFLGLNFGEEAGTAMGVRIFCTRIVQGSQQVWVAVLWHWGDQLNTIHPGAFAPK